MNRNSEIIICNNIKLEKGYKDVLDYTEQQMVSLCRANAVASSNKYSFIRSERNTIKTSFSYNDTLKCNYMAFQNSDYSNKWFFAFIDEVVYANDGTSKIIYTIDEFSTWWDYWLPSPCFVVREHVNDDTVGLHTYPEGLETGDYIIDKTVRLQAFTSFLPCLAVTELPSPPLTDVDPPTLYQYGGIFNGLAYIIGENIDGVSNIIRTYDKMGKADAIQYVFMIPSILAQNVEWVTVAGWSWTCKYGQIPSGSGFFSGSIGGFNKPASLDGYVPKNKKLLTFPYCYINLDNNNGSVCTLKYEDFTSNTYGFSVDCVITPSCSTKITPLNYKKVNENNIFSITGGKFPICSWSSDIYTNYLTQQAVNNSLSLISSTSNIIGGAIKGNTSEIGSGVNSITSLLAENYQKDLIPYQVKGNTNSGDVNFAKNLYDPIVYEFSIKQEYARIIDDYFSSFGYKVNRIKVPNQTGRENWNFVQIGDSENIGYSVNNTQCVPAKSMDIINSIYRNGVTIWHNHTNLGNYSLSNNIVN